ncbi:T9SS type A sorting domain-containing protein [Geojedonia litorea]|uniref:T9SS type A sorting domain-containing protein n=1 Tax=Geojedonia litorea TaxID=1268269 RepID=A0ABV9N466_9FLAO
MKKIMFLLMLLTSMTLASQGQLFIFTQVPLETCQGTDPNSCLSIGVESDYDFREVVLHFENKNNTNDNFGFGVPILGSINTYCNNYTVGETYLIKALDIGFDPPIESETFEYTILGCSNIDNDSDGFYADVDCNDSDAAINPGADEICGDGIDNNCDGNIDEGCETCPDADNDGTCDADDLCPSDPNKIAPGDCGCGTPDTDSDGDGVADCNDNCPNDANKTEQGDCGCGTPDTDSDGDGVADCNDNCPNDANKTEPGDCGCGVADADTDNDGVFDCNDSEINSPCPNNVDANGVSIDSDSDGTPDCNDGCPSDPNKTASGDCGCGVADTDTDSDGVLDCNDSEINSPCPNNVDANGVSIDSDSDGTPDCNDGCPSDPNKTAPGDCGCGTADTDSDSDGTPDCIDECPNDSTNTCNNCPDADNDTVCDAEDRCPGADDLLDSDRDGTPDCLDLCPNDRNKTAPGLCGCGTSDADKDNDGVPDCNDVCPRGPDTDTDGDGVPDCIDICAGQDDKLDSDGDGLPDCVDSCPNDATNTCSGNTCRAGLFEICHVKKNGDRTTICVTPDQWARHKTHPGDVLGSCSPSTARTMEPENIITEEAQFSIYPNPLKTNGLWIQVSARQNNEKFTASIYDLNGRVLAQKVFDSNDKTNRYFWEFNSETWDKGIYLLKIESDEGQITKKVVVK